MQRVMTKSNDSFTYFTEHNRCMFIYDA